MHRSWLALWFLLCNVSCITAEAPSQPWIQLFNGKDLDGWTPKIRGYDAGVNFADTFVVEDGLLKVSYKSYDQFDDRFGHLFYNRQFSHYRLRVEYRFVARQAPGGEDWAWRNSGIMIHGQPLETMAKDQNFPNSIEVQLLGADQDHERTNANLCTPGTQIVIDGRLEKTHCINSTSRTYPGDQWVTVEVEVHGSESIRHVLEGQTVLAYSQPQLDDGTLLEGGTISLQSESHPIEFRKVELLQLPR